MHGYMVHFSCSQLGNCLTKLLLFALVIKKIYSQLGGNNPLCIMQLANSSSAF